MATIVLVHGIDYERESADLIEARWIPVLAEGVRLEGRPDLADRLWPSQGPPDSIDCRAAYYGHLFRVPDQQGPGGDLGDLSPDEEALAESLALEWLERIADRAEADSADAVQARRAIEIARNPETVMGWQSGLREIMRTLSRSPKVARMGMGAANWVQPALVQVTRYLNDESIREQARNSVMELVDADTKVILGHSLGSVVAYECAHLLDRPLPLLATVGSPLGLRNIVAERLIPPPSFPPLVARWLNLANREDIVAAEPDLRPRFAGDMPESSRFDGSWFEEAKKPHDAETYFGRPAIAKAVIEALG